MADCPEYTFTDGESVDCHLPEGHEGDHEGIVVWPQSPPLPPFDWDANPGYSAFLAHIYGAPMSMSSPQTVELNRARRRWWRHG